MFTPPVIATTFMFAWFLVERNLENLPAGKPRDTVIPAWFHSRYLSTISFTFMGSAGLAALSGAAHAFPVLSYATIDTTLFLAGFALSAMSARRAIEAAGILADLIRSGRQEWRKPDDYIPSLVAAPIMPCLIGAAL
jgi:hypothetical protein